MIWHYFQFQLIFQCTRARTHTYTHTFRVCYFLVCQLCISFSLYILQDEKELLENQSCPIHLKPCVARKEDNYFFALSKYQKLLEDTLTENPDFVQPSFRLNEVRQCGYFVLCYCTQALSCILGVSFYMIQIPLAFSYKFLLMSVLSESLILL